MNKEVCSKNDLLIIKKILFAITYGSYIDDDDELECLIEVNRNQLKNIEERWPNISTADSSSWMVIASCISILLSYPVEEEQKLYEELNANAETLEELFYKALAIAKEGN